MFGQSMWLIVALAALAALILFAAWLWLAPVFRRGRTAPARLAEPLPAVSAHPSALFAVAEGSQPLMTASSAESQASILLSTEEVRIAQTRGSAGGDFDSWFETIVQRSGLGMDVAAALGVILLCGVLAGGIVWVWRSNEVDWWLCIPAFMLGCVGALTFLWFRHRAWRRSVQHQLPDVYYLLARSLRAGRSLEQSFQLVAEQGNPPLNKEFERMHRQMDLGLPLSEVLELTARRLDQVDFNMFAALLALHRPVGGNLPLILDRLAASSRDRNQFEGQYRSATVLGRYSAGFVFLMVCVLLLYQFFFNRDATMRFLQTGTGMSLLMAAVGLNLAGLALLWYFVRADQA
jgi:tight adherence protein B